MQTPSVNNRTANFFKASRKPKRLKTCSESRHTYKPSVVLAELLPKARKRSKANLMSFHKKTDEERKTCKKMCYNQSSYFKTLPVEANVNELENYLCMEFFGAPVKSSCLMTSKIEFNESMEVVQLRNSSIHLSKVFNSGIFDHTPRKPTRTNENILYRENNEKLHNSNNDINSLISQLDSAIQNTDLDNFTRCKLLESINVMKKTLERRNDPLTRSFNKYLSNKRPTIINRN